MYQERDLFIARVMRSGSRIVVPVDPRTPDLPPLLTIEEAADVLNTTPTLVRTAIRLNQLPHVRLAGRDRVIVGKMYERFEAAEADREQRLARHAAG